MEYVLKRLDYLCRILKEMTSNEIAGSLSLKRSAYELREIYKQYIKTEKLTVQIIARETSIDEVLFVRLLSRARRALEIASDAANKL